MITFGGNEYGVEISEAAGCSYNPAVDPVIARVDAQGKLLGGIIYQDYTGASIHMHVAGFSPVWINQDILWAAFHYPFVQLGCRKVFGPVKANNLKTLEFDRKLGFKEEVIIRDVFPECDLILMSMHRHECRWLKIRPKTIAWNGTPAGSAAGENDGQEVGRTRGP